MDPYEIWLIVISIVLGSLAIYQGYQIKKLQGPQPPNAFARFGSVIGAFFLGLTTIIPGIVFVAPFFMDIINESYKFSIASITGFIGIFVNYFLNSAIVGGINWYSSPPSDVSTFDRIKTFFGRPPTTVVNPEIPIPPVTTGGADFNCSIPGLETWEGAVSSQSLTFVTTVLSYIIINGFDTEGYASLPIFGVGVFLIMVQTLSLTLNNCLGFTRFGATTAVIASLVLGVVMAGTSYAINKFYIPYGQSSGPTSASKTQGWGSSWLGPGTEKKVLVGQASAAAEEPDISTEFKGIDEDGEELVGELYVDGKPLKL